MFSKKRALSGLKITIMQTSKLKDRVAYAYYKYGRFCSSHPIMTILCSILALLFLSSPITRLGFQMPKNAPYDTFSCEQINCAHSPLTPNRKPQWMPSVANPYAFVQQLIMQACFERAELHPASSGQFFKAALKVSFDLQEKVSSFLARHHSANMSCFHVEKPFKPLLPQYGCLVLSPTTFWGNSISRFYEDRDVLSTIRISECTPAICLRWFAFGMPLKRTGLKRPLVVNDHRCVQFVTTVFFERISSESRHALKREIVAMFPNSVPPDATVEDGIAGSFVNVFYNQSKTLMDFLPLMLSYVVLFAYIYYSVSKIAMVKSKWGLAFSSVFTVASSLFMAVGICIQFGLYTSSFVWNNKLFPYIAMIVGLENTLCITKSVVQTPVHLDVSSRIAYGLSREGYSITKNFLVEMSILMAGFLSFLPEIQEFCVFGCIGLVVDFYMQLFFYAPCLTFDLLRIDPTNLQAANRLVHDHNSYDLPDYAPVSCPFAWILPRSLRRSRLSINKKHEARHRRASSNASDASVDLQMPEDASARISQADSAEPRRMRFINFWAGRRLVQRCLMLFTILWIVWFAVIVQQFHAISREHVLLPNDLHSDNASQHPWTKKENPDVRQAELASDSRLATTKSRTLRDLFSRSTLDWQAETFGYWPNLLNLYNLSLSGRYVTVLPAILLKTFVSQEHMELVRSGDAPDSRSSDFESSDETAQTYDHDDFRLRPEIALRISWLEVQMTIVLCLSCGIFIVVFIFVLYVCFAGANSGSTVSSGLLTEMPLTKSKLRSSVFDAVPLIFGAHHTRVELLVAAPSGFLASASTDGKVYVWNGRTGQLLCKIPKKALRNECSITDAAAYSNLRQRNKKQQTADDLNVAIDCVWSLCIFNNILVLGYASGVIEFWDVSGGIFVYHIPPQPGHTGATQLAFRSGWLIAARLNGSLELYFQSSDESSHTCRFRLVHSVRAHQQSIEFLQASSTRIATAAGEGLVKIHGLTTGTLCHAFQTDSVGAICSLLLDETLTSSRLFVCLDTGFVYQWDLVSNRLLRKLQFDTGAALTVSLAVCQTRLIARSSEGAIWVWDISSGQLLTEVQSSCATSTALHRCSDFVLLSDTVALCSMNCCVEVWDLQHPPRLLRDIAVPSNNSNEAISLLTKLDATTVNNTIYKIRIEATK